MRHLGILAALALSSAAHGLVMGPVPSNFVLDGSVEEWRGRPPAAKTARPDGKDSVDLWVGQTKQGFVVAGRLDDPRFPFAGTTAEQESGSRLEIWLSVAEDFEFPPPVFNEENCAASDVKATCLAWFKRESDFRDKAKKFFTRMWRVVPSAAEEAYALPAFNSMTDAEQEALRFPRPDGLPERKFRTTADGAVTFEILIPWNLFPPANRLNLERVKFRVDFNAGGFAAPSTDVVAVTPPVVSRIGGCAQPLSSFDARGEESPAFYFPGTDGRGPGAMFIFDNYQEPYMPDSPPADYKGLLTTSVAEFTQALGKDEFICGPYLSYRKGNVVKQFPIWMGEPGTSLTVPSKPLLVKTMPDGLRLFRLGPEESMYPLSHKAAMIWTMKIYSLSAALEAREALIVSAWMHGINGFEIEMSDDWRRVTVFREVDHWESETFCLAGEVYESCGNNPNAAAPKRVLTRDQ